MPSNLPPEPIIGKYIDLLTDFGFKRIFGTEPNKDLLIDLLNSIFAGRKHIVDLTYNKNEHPGDIREEGSGIFDLTCTGAAGEKFIIEVQRCRPVNFKQRAIYYTSLTIAGLAPRGRRSEWGYEFPEVYFIGLLEDFTLDEDGDGRYVRDISLMDRHTGKAFHSGLGYIFLELVNFVKEEGELDNELDKWLYVLKNIRKLDKIPVYLRKPIFEKLFSIAEYSNMTREEKTMYNQALKQKWDRKAQFDYAIQTALEAERQRTDALIAKAEEGRIKAEAEKIQLQQKAEAEKMQLQQQAETEKIAERRFVAQSFHSMGMPIADIAKGLGLTADEVGELLRD